jgi:G3E family GTPase
MGDTVRQQLADADLLLLNKVDFVSSETLSELRAWLPSIAPQAALVACAQAQVPAELVYGTLGAARDEARRDWRPTPMASPPSAPAADTFVSHRLDLPPGVDLAALSARLSAPHTGLLRAKGWVFDHQRQRWLVQTVGTCVQMTPAPSAEDAPSGTLVMIGLRSQFDPQAW